MKRKLFILLDYRSTFYSSTRAVAGSMDVSKIKILFEKRGYDVEVEKFSQVDFYSKKYVGAFVLYQSSEDPDLRYKDYIEDILLGLQLRGAILVPDIYKFRAHHNKVFMEIMRDVSGFALIQNIKSVKCGTLNDLKDSLNQQKLPVVVKAGSGAKSVGVKLARTKKEALCFSRKVSSSFSLINFKRFISMLLKGKMFRPISNYRKKFIVQNFVPNLLFDYKILVYGDKFFVLKRENRAGDFRASGSGLLSFPEKLPAGLLDYARKVFEFFKVPFVSLDIGICSDEFFLLEFQFVSFGQYALEKSSFYFKKEDSQWMKIEGYSNLEEDFVYAVNKYINLLDKGEV